MSLRESCSHTTSRTQQPVLYPEVMDRPLTITESEPQRFEERFELSNIRDAPDDAPSALQQQLDAINGTAAAASGAGRDRDGDAEMHDRASRDSSPLSDASSLTDVSVVERQVKDVVSSSSSSAAGAGAGAGAASFFFPRRSGARSWAAAGGEDDGEEEEEGGSASLRPSWLPPRPPRAATTLISYERLQQLAAVQRLIEAKGEAAMLKFLLDPETTTRAQPLRSVPEQQQQQQTTGTSGSAAPGPST